MQTPTPGLDAVTPTVKFSQKDIFRFWSKVNKDGPLPDQSNPHYQGLGQCWIWLRGCDNHGYGQFLVSQKKMKSHRAAWELIQGTIPESMSVLHRCDNPSCCNPDHLFLGNMSENMKDRHAKGRTTHGDDHYYRRSPEKIRRGRESGQAKLSEDDVREIRERYSSGSEFQRVIAADYGVHQSVVSEIVNRIRWIHVD